MVPVLAGAACLASARAESPVLAWNRLLLDVTRAGNFAPTLTSRNLAMLHTAVFDAVNSIEQTHQPYRFPAAPTLPASGESAAHAAAYTVMMVLYPQYGALFDHTYQAYLASTAPTPARSNGIALGEWVGWLTVEARRDDGSATQVPYVPVDEPGQWRRTPPHYRPPADPHWRYVDPFCLPAIEAFVVPPHPALDSELYARDLHHVRDLGAANSPARTAEQGEVARFWADFSYTATPPGHWQEIAAEIAAGRELSLAAEARLFALLSLAQADAGIVAWEGKYRYNAWRPVTAIRRADEDANPETAPDPGWTSLLEAPAFPEYPSGHSTFSMASAAALARVLGTDTLAFHAVSESLPGAVRAFDSLSGCADEIGMSRIYGGIHFMTANLEGKASGARIGAYVVANYLLANDRLPLLRWETGPAGHPRLRAHGRIDDRCVVEASDDLRHWRPVWTNDARVGGSLVPADATRGGGLRAFRIRAAR